MKYLILALFLGAFFSIVLGLILDLPYSEKLVGFGVTGLFLVVFPLFWSGIVFFLSILGGWGTMAESYPERIKIDPQCFSAQRAILGISVNYNGVLNICADYEGLHFSVMFMFRPGHRPFFVPWEDIHAVKKQHFLFQVVEMRFARTQNRPFRIYLKLADQLVAASNGRWSYEGRE